MNLILNITCGVDPLNIKAHSLNYHCHAWLISQHNLQHSQLQLEIIYWLYFYKIHTKVVYTIIPLAVLSLLLWFVLEETGLPALGVYDTLPPHHPLP